MLTDEEVHKNLRDIARKFTLFQCQMCADEMRRCLQAQHIGGVQLMLRARGGNFMISERVGGDVSITQNGRHYGIEARGKVFDNLPGTGISRQTWLDNFECIGGFDIEETLF